MTLFITLLGGVFGSLIAAFLSNRLLDTIVALAAKGRRARWRATSAESYLAFVMTAPSNGQLVMRPDVDATLASDIITNELIVTATPKRRGSFSVERATPQSSSAAIVVATAA